jgi:hypothetical protein
MSSNKHQNYEILNLIGYGLAKFDKDFIGQFNCASKNEFYQKMVDINLADTVGTVKNRQDLFDPFFENGRQGWWQKGNVYIHRKEFIDSLFGTYNLSDYASMVKLYIANNFKAYAGEAISASPIIKSKFKQLQATGKEAELFFFNNYNTISEFTDATIEDARLLGDGYDFQLQRTKTGAFRMTENEYAKADEYRSDFGLVIVSNLEETPKMTTIFNPLSNFELIKKSSTINQISYHSPSLRW